MERINEMDIPRLYEEHQRNLFFQRFHQQANDNIRASHVSRSLSSVNNPGDERGIDFLGGFCPVKRTCEVDSDHDDLEAESERPAKRLRTVETYEERSDSVARPGPYGLPLEDRLAVSEFTATRKDDERSERRSRPVPHGLPLHHDFDFSAFYGNGNADDEVVRPFKDVQHVEREDEEDYRSLKVATGIHSNIRIDRLRGGPVRSVSALLGSPGYRYLPPVRPDTPMPQILQEEEHRQWQQEQQRQHEEEQRRQLQLLHHDQIQLREQLHRLNSQNLSDQSAISENHILHSIEDELDSLVRDENVDPRMKFIHYKPGQFSQDNETEYDTDLEEEEENVGPDSYSREENWDSESESDIHEPQARGSRDASVRPGRDWNPSEYYADGESDSECEERGAPNGYRLGDLSSIENGGRSPLHGPPSPHISPSPDLRENSPYSGPLRPPSTNTYPHDEYLETRLYSPGALPIPNSEVSSLVGYNGDAELNPPGELSSPSWDSEDYFEPSASEPAPSELGYSELSSLDSGSSKRSASPSRGLPDMNQEDGLDNVSGASTSTLRASTPSSEVASYSPPPASSLSPPSPAELPAEHPAAVQAANVPLIAEHTASRQPAVPAAPVSDAQPAAEHPADLPPPYSQHVFPGIPSAVGAHFDAQVLESLRTFIRAGDYWRIEHAIPRALETLIEEDYAGEEPSIITRRVGYLLIATLNALQDIAGVSIPGIQILDDEE